MSVISINFFMEISFLSVALGTRYKWMLFSAFLWLLTKLQSNCLIGYDYFVVIAAPSDGKKYESKDDELPVDIKLPVKHVLSRELQVFNLQSTFKYIYFSSCHIYILFLLFLQLYFEKITELVVSKSDSVLFKEALVSLATDSGLHPLVPYFTCFIADEVPMVD